MGETRENTFDDNDLAAIREEAEWARQHVTRARDLLGSWGWRRQWAKRGPDLVITALEQYAESEGSANRATSEAEATCRKAHAWRTIESVELRTDSPSHDTATELLKNAVHLRSKAEAHQAESAAKIQEISKRRRIRQDEVTKLSDQLAKAVERLAEATDKQRKQSDRAAELHKQRQEVRTQLEALKPLLERARLQLGLPPTA